MISNSEFGRSIIWYRQITNRDPRYDDKGNIRPQIHIIRSINELRDKIAKATKSLEEYNKKNPSFPEPIYDKPYYCEGDDKWVVSEIEKGYTVKVSHVFDYEDEAYEFYTKNKFRRHG